MSDLRRYMPGERAGTPGSRMIRLIAEHGHNDELQLDFATITSMDPIEMVLNRDELPLDDEDIMLPERLTKHTEWHDGLPVTVDPRLEVGEVVVGMMDEHKGYFAVIDRVRKSEVEEWEE